MSPQRSRCSTPNRLLRAFPEATLDRLWPELEPVELARRQILHAIDKPIRHLYFVESGLVSSVKTMHDGSMIEVGAVGVEGAAGTTAILGADHSVLDSIVHVPGWGRRIGWDIFRSAMRASPSLHGLMLRYAHLTISQLAQAAACNRLHSMEQRCCRWLLIAHDSAPSDSVPLTHESLAMMLGVQRTGVSLTVNVLQRAGLVCRERRILKGDGGRFTTPPLSRLEARSRLGCQSASELGAPAVSSTPEQLPGHEPASTRKGYEDG